jgi:hypothetical protein
LKKASLVFWKRWSTWHSAGSPPVIRNSGSTAIVGQCDTKPAPGEDCFARVGGVNYLEILKAIHRNLRPAMDRLQDLEVVDPADAGEAIFTRCGFGVEELHRRYLVASVERVNAAAEVPDTRQAPPQALSA